MGGRKFAARGIALAWAAAFPLAARAEPPPSVDPASPPSSPPARASQDAAAIVFVGDVTETSVLAPLLTELLGREQVALRFLHEARFDAGELLGQGERDRAAWVFVEVPDRRTARLFFRGPEGRRFLLRELALRDGLDEWGSELLGQIIASSVVSLLRSAAGISLEQARVALSARTPDVFAPRAGSDGSVLPLARPVAPRRWSGWLAARYEGEWSGSDLGGAQGPGAELGVEWRGPLRVRASLAALRWFTQTFTSSEVAARVETWPVRGQVALGWSVARTQSWLLGLGAGFDVTRVAPGPAQDPAVRVAVASTRAVPVVRLGTRYEVGVEPWRVGLEVFVDASPLFTHYDLQRGDAVDRVLVPWSVRPGAALVVGWQPSP